VSNPFRVQKGKSGDHLAIDRMTNQGRLLDTQVIHQPRGIRRPQVHAVGDFRLGGLSPSQAVLRDDPVSFFTQCSNLVLYELREAQHFAETQAAVQRLDQMPLAQTEMAMSESLGQIRVKAKSDGVHALTPEELYRLQRWEQSVALRMRSQYIQYTRGYLDEATAEGILLDAATSLPFWEELGIDLGDSGFSRAVLLRVGRERR
jgi:hypothetical protein